VSPWLTLLLVVAVAVLVVAVAAVVYLNGVSKSQLGFAREKHIVKPLDGEKPASKGALAPDAPYEVDVRDRMGVLSGAIAAFFGVLFLRLWGMQLMSGTSYTERAEQNLLREVSIRAPRGRIYDRNGVVLVNNRASMALVAERTVADNSRLVRRISNLLGMPRSPSATTS